MASSIAAFDLINAATELISKASAAFKFMIRFERAEGTEHGRE